VRVVCRFRPLNSKELAGGWGEICSFPDPKTVTIKGKESHSFGFDRVFPTTTTQQEMFDEVAKPTIDDILRGYNGTIFVYGQTSSGKTHTMQGPDIDNPDQRGIIPRTSYTLFELVDQMKKNDRNLEITVTMSSVEIYMEKIRDLLTDDNNTKKGLEVKEGAKGIYIEGVREEIVHSGLDVLKWIKKATSNRSIAATKMNAESSRSHSLFIITINQKSIADGSSKNGKLYLVDLAGSEKVEKTGAEGKTLDEAKKINLSLSTLGNVINALTDPKKASHIPYRESKLTRVLQESLGGNSKTTLIINCSPSSFNEFETLSTLRFGARAKSIKNAAKINKQQTVEELQLLLKQAEKENQRLQQTITDLQEENRVLKGGGGYVVENNQEEPSRSRSRSIHRSGSFDNMQVLQEQLPNVVKLHEKVADLENYVDRLEKEKVNFLDRLEEKELENEILTENLVETNMRLQESLEELKDLKAYSQQKLRLIERDAQMRNRKFAQLEKIFDEQFDKTLAKIAQEHSVMKFENQAYLRMVQIRDEKIQSLQMILRHTEERLRKFTEKSNMPAQVEVAT